MQNLHLSLVTVLDGILRIQDSKWYVLGAIVFFMTWWILVVLKLQISLCFFSCRKHSESLKNWTRNRKVWLIYSQRRGSGETRRRRIWERSLRLSASPLPLFTTGWNLLSMLFEYFLLIDHRWTTHELYPCRMHQIPFKSCLTRSGCWRRWNLLISKDVESSVYQSLPPAISCADWSSSI